MVRFVKVISTYVTYLFGVFCMFRCAALILSVLFVMQKIWLKCSIVSAGAKNSAGFSLFFLKHHRLSPSL